MPRLRLPLIPRWLRVTATITVALVILIYSIRDPPGSGTIRMGPFGLLPYTMWLHLLAYGGLAGTVAYALHEHPRPDWQHVLAVVVVVAAYGSSIELLQATLADRQADLADAGVNTFGAGLAAIAWRLLARSARFYRVHHPGDLKPPIG